MYETGVERQQRLKRKFGNFASAGSAYVYFDSRQTTNRTDKGKRFYMDLPQQIVTRADMYRAMRIDAVGIYNNVPNMTDAERTYSATVWAKSNPDIKRTFTSTLPDQCYTFSTGASSIFIMLQTAFAEDLRTQLSLLSVDLGITVAANAVQLEEIPGQGKYKLMIDSGDVTAAPNFVI